VKASEPLSEDITVCKTSYRLMLGAGLLCDGWMDGWTQQVIVKYEVLQVERGGYYCVPCVW